MLMKHDGRESGERWYLIFKVYVCRRSVQFTCIANQFVWSPISELFSPFQVSVFLQKVSSCMNLIVIAAICNLYSSRRIQVN
jgi:hypothetical protein